MSKVGRASRAAVAVRAVIVAPAGYHPRPRSFLRSPPRCASYYANLRGIGALLLHYCPTYCYQQSAVAVPAARGGFELLASVLK